jgi:RNA polymerase sigma-70 factor, ECF subfamily
MDRELVERAQHGDREAFAEIVRELSDRLYGIAFRILRDQSLAQDALQTTLLIAWRDVRRLRDVDRFEVWVRRILVNACYEESRDRTKWRANVRLLPVDVPTAQRDDEAVIDRDLLERSFRVLSMEQRAIFVLHHHLGLPLVEIAETLGIPAGTARSRLHYATRALRAALEMGAETPIVRERLA